MLNRSKRDPEDPLDPLNHPIQIVGNEIIGSNMTIKDLSPWKSQYPIYRYEWFISSEIGNDNDFHPTPFCTGINATVPFTALGYHIQLVATRDVEMEVSRFGLPAEYV